ncbi:hypothetical protein PQR62_00735 [Herbaspirillum lusitanum]|uniref:Uncharacterized protein n=1 Tax=Herbaspirillum lusitanum TaxID=213312 RepID=A0ABW9A3I1_9BURK
MRNSAQSHVGPRFFLPFEPWGQSVTSSKYSALKFWKNKHFFRFFTFPPDDLHILFMQTVLFLFYNKIAESRLLLLRSGAPLAR